MGKVEAFQSRLALLGVELDGYIDKTENAADQLRSARRDYLIAISLAMSSMTLAYSTTEMIPPYLILSFILMLLVLPYLVYIQLTMSVVAILDFKMADNIYNPVNGFIIFLVIKNKFFDTKMSYLSAIVFKIWPKIEYCRFQWWPF